MGVNHGVFIVRSQELSYISRRRSMQNFTMAQIYVTARDRISFLDVMPSDCPPAEMGISNAESAINSRSNAQNSS